MDTSSEIVNLSNQLAQAVEAALNPEVPQGKRHEAYYACEEFKEKSPLGIPCSLYLSLHGSHLVRHFGLQLMEYCVKYKWYDIDQSQKISIKDVTMSLMQSSEGDLMRYVHLRDALSRVVVEMMKREWPQHWPNLLPELYQIAAKGHIQAEIVLLVFLRFIEDIVVLQTLEYAQRRRDLYQHLTLQLEEVFTFLLNLMGQHYSLNVPESVRVINLALKLLSEIIEFAFVNRLAAEETRLLPVLCNLLSNENFQIETAETLNRIAMKKGKHEDKRIICKLLLHSPLLNCISHLNLMSQNGIVTESSYMFLKKVSELLASICSLLCTVVKNENECVYDFISIENFVVFLEMLVNLCSHPSLIISFHANTCWTSLFKHSILNKDSNVLNNITKWVSQVTPKLIRIPYKSEHKIPLFQDCYKYLPLDFDSEEAFITFYHRFRVELTEAFKHLAVLAPSVVFGCFEQWLITRIEKTSATSKSFCLPFSEEYLEWEAISTIADVIILNLPKTHGIPLERSLRLLHLCFSLKPADPNIMSFLLSCISPLMFFVNEAPSEVVNVYMPRLLEHVFSSIVFEIPGENRCSRSKNARNLRRHATSLLVKLSRMYPTLFLPFFGHIRNVFNDLKRDVNQLNKSELVIFLESLLQINNGFCDFNRQSLFIKEVFDEVKDYWISLTTDVFCDYLKFSSFVGLDVKPCHDEAIFKNQRELMYCVDVIATIVRRSVWPESKEACMMGGFVISMSSIGGDQPVYQNPATAHILPAMPGIFSLIKVMHYLWTKDARSKLPSEYEKVHEMSELELKTLLGSHVPLKEYYSAEPTTSGVGGSTLKMQYFLSTLYESCFTVLTKACQNLGNSFYEFPNFAPIFGASVFSNLDSVPDYRLRVMVKMFFKPFIYCCPPDMYDSLLVPIIEYFTTYMYERLSNKWKYLQECRENSKRDNEDDTEDGQELVEHLINTQLSREYMDVVKTMLLKPNNNDLKQCNGMYICI